MTPIKALPDEMILSFKARLGIVYGMPSSGALDRKLVAAHKRLTGEDVRPITALIRLGAAAAQCSEWQFLMQHSSVSVNAPVDNPLTVDELSSRMCNSRIAQIMSPGASRFRLCGHCVEEDLRALGFSFWRRSHHIPGRYVCETHDAPLRLVRPELPLASSPHELLDSAETADAFLVQNHYHNHYVRWYLDHMDQVVAGLRTCDGRIQKTEIYSELRSWRRSGAGWVTQLACLIVDAFTVEWLAATVSKACSSIEGIATNIVPPLLYHYLPVSHPELAVAAGLAFARQD